jgi:(S)-2-hydroxyglutarate dehydrogenase
LYDKIIVGGGIVGLATALNIRLADSSCKLAVIEKENDWAQHQSSRNSGVIHAGIYYEPGSKKARFALAGNASMYEFCNKWEIPHDRCGKLIVATRTDQLPALNSLRLRAELNGIEVKQITSAEAQEVEPHVNCLAALHVPSTGIVDFRMVAAKFVEILSGMDVDLYLGTKVHGMTELESGYILESNRGDFETKFLIATAGLYADRITQMAGINPEMRIIPFRGEYWHLKNDRKYLVRNLIYPVPNPSFPFLGVHLTRLIDGSIHAGPNAVLAFSREGYDWVTLCPRDIIESISYPGFWKLAVDNFGEGLMEIYRSVVKTAFLKSVQELIPEIRSSDLVRGNAGVRAQALGANGSLISDFQIKKRKNGIFVLNAPSPAATASLEIGKYIANLIA